MKLLIILLLCVGNSYTTTSTSTSTTTSTTTSTSTTTTSIQDGLVNHWPMSSMEDIVGKSNLFGGSNWQFVNDRFNNPVSAIYFNSGYLQVPQGVYFDDNYSFTCWANFRSNIDHGRIFDFGDGKAIDNIILNLYGNTTRLFAQIYKGNVLSGTSLSPNAIPLNNWMHVAYVQQGTNNSMYINGTLVKTSTTVRANGVIRSFNYFGKSNWNNPNIDAVFEENLTFCYIR